LYLKKGERGKGKKGPGTGDGGPGKRNKRFLKPHAGSPPEKEIMAEIQQPVITIVMQIYRKFSQ
jgi:hypothetical protein